MHRPHPHFDTEITGLPAADRIVCHCLHVSEMEIRGSVSTGAVETLKAVMECTGAGAGCTACHQRIRELLHECATREERLAHSSR
jgi:bacterioferritin-associated ferredoxin